MTDFEVTSPGTLNLVEQQAAEIDRLTAEVSHHHKRIIKQSIESRLAQMRSDLRHLVNYLNADGSYNIASEGQYALLQLASLSDALGEYGFNELDIEWITSDVPIEATE